MSEKKLKYLLLIIFSFLFIAFFELSSYFGKYAEDNLSAVSARYHTASISPKAVAAAIANKHKDSNEDIPEITLWNRLAKESIRNKTTGINTVTNIIETSGDMSQTIPMTFINGNYTYKDDGKGCVLDSKTAYQLFGTTNVLNNIVIWKEKEYIVRGVVKAKDTMMIFQILDEDHLYSNLEAVYQSKRIKSMNDIIDNQGKLLEDFLVQNGMSQPDGVFDGAEIVWYLNLICRLPLWIIGIQLVLLLVRKTYQLKKSIIMCITFSTATLLISFMIIKMMHFNIHIPNQYIPTKWSDFDYYIDTFKKIQENTIRNNDVKLMPKDMVRNTIRYRCTLYSTVSLCLLVLYHRMILITGKTA